MASSKRIASSDLNHNNWDEEEEPEGAGTFSKAADAILKNRVIKVAKRRNPIGSSATTTPVIEPEKTGVFANFGGFSKMQPSTTSSFSFLSNITSSVEQPKTNGLGVTTATSTSLVDKSADVDEPQYYAKIKGLNQSVSKWIKKHVDTNPFLNLTPIFRDYERHIEEIERLNSCVLATTKITESKMSDEKTNSLKGEDWKNITFTAKSTEAPTFSFGKTNVPQVNSGTAGFTFGTDTSKPCAFTNVESPENATETEDKPPKVDFTPVVEDGHIYTIRCKVFVKKGESYSDRGIGTLYLKPVPDNDKVQLIIRADTNLGLLLCNFILSNSIPMQRMGKKDVMLVCIPLPDSKPPPVPVLLRVKSPEEADELLKILERHKK